MSETTHHYKRDGVWVVATPVKPKEERKFRTRDIVDLISQYRKQIESNTQAIADADTTKERALFQLQKDKDTLKELADHEEWALSVQHSRLKALCEEKREEKIAKVDTEYKDDPTLSANQNLRQKFVQFRGYLAMDSQISEEISSEIIRDKLFVNCELKTPWPVNPYHT